MSVVLYANDTGPLVGLAELAEMVCRLQVTYTGFEAFMSIPSTHVFMYLCYVKDLHKT